MILLFPNSGLLATCPTQVKDARSCDNCPRVDQPHFLLFPDVPISQKAKENLLNGTQMAEKVNNNFNLAS